MSRPENCGAARTRRILSVVDREGNMVSLIQSNFAAFGSGIVAAGTGFVLHDRGGLFTLDPASPNALAGRKRPLHTIIPAFAQKGDTRVAFGIMGGWNQSQAHAQFVANIADFKMNIQAALEAPRFSSHLQWVRCVDGEPLCRQCTQRADLQGSQNRFKTGLFQRDGRGAGGA